MKAKLLCNIFIKDDGEGYIKQVVKKDTILDIFVKDGNMISIYGYLHKDLIEIIRRF